MKQSNEELAKKIARGTYLHNLGANLNQNFCMMIRADLERRIITALTNQRNEILEEAAEIAIKTVTKLSVNELIPFEQVEPFKRLSEVIANAIRKLKEK